MERSECKKCGAHILAKTSFCSVCGQYKFKLSRLVINMLITTIFVVCLASSFILAMQIKG